MAASVAVQSFFTSPITSKTRALKPHPLSYVPYLPKRSNMRIRSMADEDNEKQTATPSSSPSPAPSPIPPPKVSTKFEDVLAFSGPGPEIINGRLAMIGFIAAIGVELAKGQDLFSQITEGGLPWFIGTSIVLSLASLIPLFKGVRAEDEKGGIMTPDAELWNGRLAMLGLVALAFTEYVKGGALV